MKEDAMNNGQTKPGYNLQIATANQYILNYGFYPISTDTTTLESFIDLGYTRFGVMPKAICADAGYLLFVHQNIHQKGITTPQKTKY